MLLTIIGMDFDAIINGLAGGNRLVVSRPTISESYYYSSGTIEYMYISFTLVQHG